MNNKKFSENELFKDTKAVKYTKNMFVKRTHFLVLKIQIEVKHCNHRRIELIFY